MAWCIHKVWDGQHEQSLTLKILSAAGCRTLIENPVNDLCGDRGLVFAAGKEALALLEVQLEGKRRMSGGEFVRGHRWIARPLR